MTCIFAGDQIGASQCFQCAGTQVGKISDWCCHDDERAHADCRALQLELLEVAAKLVAQTGPLQGKLDSGLEKSELVAGVVAGSFDHVGIYRLLFQEQTDAVGKLYLSTSAPFGVSRTLKISGVRI